MSSPIERARAKLGRAERALAIREARKEGQDEFARALNEAAKRLGLPGGYEKFKVSRMETASRVMTSVDAVLWASLDPERRGVPWLVAGLPIYEGGDVPTPEKQKKKA